MNKSIKKITGAASVATLLLSMSTAALAESEPQPLTCIDLRTLPKEQVNILKQQSKFFAGKITKVDGDKVYVDKLFYFDSGLAKEDVAYINVADYKDKEIKYTVGDIISVTFETINKVGVENEIVPTDAPYVEKDEMCTIMPITTAPALTSKEPSTCIDLRTLPNEEAEKLEEDNNYFKSLPKEVQERKDIIHLFAGVDPVYNVGDSKSKEEAGKIQNQNKFFAGKITKVDGDKIFVEKLFAYDSGLGDKDTVYVNVADYKKEKIEYKVGNIISLEYKEINNVGNNKEIKPLTVPVVEEDQIMTIQGLNNNLTTDNINKQPSTCIDLRTLPKEEQDKLLNQADFFAGKIIKVDGTKVYVEKLFALDSGLDKETVYINVEDFKNENIDYKVGNIISFEYKGIKEVGDSKEITPLKKPTVEEDKQAVTFAGELGSLAQQSSFFRGKVVSQDGDKIVVEPYFDLDTKFNKDDKVYVTIANAELKEGQSKEVKAGQIITVNYSELNKKENETEIVAKSFNAIDEKDEVMYTASPAGEGQSEVTSVPEKTGFFASIGNFFKGIFSTIGGFFN